MGTERLTRRKFLKTTSIGFSVTLLFGCAVLSSAKTAGPKLPGKPNFIVIFTDDQGYQDLGCFASPDIRTPNVDRMAEEGMRFTHFYAHTQLLAVRSGKWKLHLPRKVSTMQRWNVFHRESDIIDFTKPLLYDLEKDPGEKHNLADKHPDTVRELTHLADWARKDIGDYDCIGENARFFDPEPRRPDITKWVDR